MKISVVYLIVFISILFLALMVLRQPSVIVQPNHPVQFSSVRKHPFDVFADPYHPPEMDNPYVLNPNYQQVGFIKGQDRAGILPLFGRPSPRNQSKWEYYTMTDGIKLPINYKGKKCYDNGCDEISSKDEIRVSGLGTYQSHLYDVKDITRL